MALPFANGSFEAAGSSAGNADAWTTTVVANGRTIGDFSGGAGVRLSVEHFAWDAATWAATFTPGSSAVFDLGVARTPNFVEGYGYWTHNASWSPVITNGAAASFAPSGGTVESWDQPGYETAITSPAHTFGESFDVSGWSSSATGGTPAGFRQHTQSIESFGPHQADVAFIVFPGSANTFQAVDARTYQPISHGLAESFAVVVLTSGTRPSGLLQAVRYYVRNPAGPLFRLSLTVGGALVNVTDAGSGLSQLHADETLYWTH